MRSFSRAFSLPITLRAGVPCALGTIRFDNVEGDGDENMKKAIGSISKNHAFFVHFFAVSARLRRENA